MYKHLNQSLKEAYSLLEEDDFNEIDIEDIPEEEEFKIEIENEDSKEEELEARISELEETVEQIKDELPGNKDVPGEFNEFEISTNAALSPEEKFSNDVYKDFIFFSDLDESCEITEELLDKNSCKNAYIPSVANKYKISSKEVKDILLNRKSER